jgi:hypothetical protein
LDYNTYIHGTITMKPPYDYLTQTKTENRKAKQVLLGVSTRSGEDIWKG